MAWHTFRGGGNAAYKIYRTLSLMKENANTSTGEYIACIVKNMAAKKMPCVARNKRSGVAACGRKAARLIIAARQRRQPPAA